VDSFSHFSPFFCRFKTSLPTPLVFLANMMPKILDVLLPIQERQKCAFIPTQSDSPRNNHSQVVAWFFFPVFFSAGLLNGAMLAFPSVIPVGPPWRASRVSFLSVHNKVDGFVFPSATFFE